ncbi:hypothetical protein MNV49_001430 [Pseudohyphozyma bogoriensis]|nr:hypothetical protein MNV49_001430 [Pseudohyphozyma bogoriensis]
MSQTTNTSAGPTIASVLMPVPPPSSTPFASSSVAAPIVPYDPNAGGSDDEDDDDDSGRPKKKRKGVATGAPGGSGGEAAPAEGGEAVEEDPEKGRRKIEIAYIQKKEKRHITFSKRKAGIMKKAYELATLTGTQVLLLVVSETGIVYTFTTAKFQPLVGAGPGGAPSEGQRLIQACLAVDPNDGSDYISPPPDGPLLPLPPSAVNRPFEANSSIHGGQIALRTRAHRPGAGNRSKPRPAAIRTQSGPSVANSLPTPAIDHGGMLLSPSARGPHSMQHHQSGDFSPLPSVLQGSVGPRGEPITSAQEFEMMQQRSPLSGGYPNSGGHPPVSPGYPPAGMDYSIHSPTHSPLQNQQTHHLQQQQRMADMSESNHRRSYTGEEPHHRLSYGDDPSMLPPHERGSPNTMYHPQQHPGAVYQSQMAAQDEYMAMQQSQGRR